MPSPTEQAVDRREIVRDWFKRQASAPTTPPDEAVDVLLTQLDQSTPPREDARPAVEDLIHAAAEVQSYYGIEVVEAAAYDEAQAHLGMVLARDRDLLNRWIEAAPLTAQPSEDKRDTGTCERCGEPWPDHAMSAEADARRGASTGVTYVCEDGARTFRPYGTDHKQPDPEDGAAYRERRDG